MEKPRVSLLGKDSNVFNLLGLCRRAALRQGWSTSKWEVFQDKCMKGGSYDMVLGYIMEEFDVE